MNDINTEALQAAMKTAVETGLLPKHADTDTYLKQWDAMRQCLQAAQDASPPAVTDINLQADEPHDCGGIEKLRERLEKCDRDRPMIVHPVILSGLFASLDGARQILDTERAVTDISGQEGEREADWDNDAFREAFEEAKSTDKFRDAEEEMVAAEYFKDGWSAALAQPVASEVNTQASERDALERDWNRLMDALGCDETDTALAKIAALSQPPAVQVPDVSLIDEGNIHAAKGGE